VEIELVFGGLFFVPNWLSLSKVGTGLRLFRANSSRRGAMPAGPKILISVINTDPFFISRVSPATDARGGERRGGRESCVPARVQCTARSHARTAPRGCVVGGYRLAALPSTAQAASPLTPPQSQDVARDAQEGLLHGRPTGAPALQQAMCAHALRARTAWRRHRPPLCGACACVRARTVATRHKSSSRGGQRRGPDAGEDWAVTCACLGELGSRP